MAVDKASIKVPGPRYSKMNWDRALEYSDIRCRQLRKTKGKTREQIISLYKELGLEFMIPFISIVDGKQSM